MTLPERVEPTVRDMTVGAALWRAAEVPMASRRREPTLPAWPRSSPSGAQARRADAVAAALLAEAATWAAAGLVRVNLTITAEDKRIQQANGWAIRPRALPARPFRLWARRNIVLWPSRHQSAARRGASAGTAESLALPTSGRARHA